LLPVLDLALSLLLCEDESVLEEESEDVLEECEEEDEELEELVEENDDDEELELSRLLLHSGGCLRFDWLPFEGLESGSFVLLARVSAVHVEAVEAGCFETLSFGPLFLCWVARSSVSSANSTKPLATDDGFRFASYCCLDSLPKEILFAVLCGRTHASRMG
jgi:hypothetical protein